MFKLRASAGGKLATNPRSKTELLSETTKTYIKEWLTEQIYGVKKEISSKYLTKGIELEDEAIEYLVANSDLPFFLKNDERFEDEYFVGTPDIVTDEFIIDIKCSWDCFTFPLFEEEIPNKDYFYQLQIYMHLTGVKKAKLVYILMNTPQELSYELVHDYSGIEASKRIKTFEFDYDENVIKDLIEKVKISRNYIKQLEK